MTRACINLSNLVDNVNLLKQRAGSCEIFGVLTADAYGHGAVTVAKTISSLVHGFAVGRCLEAMELRAAGLVNPIIILGGSVSVQDLLRVSREACDLVVHNETMVKMLETTLLDQPVRVWMELDLGLNISGFRNKDERADVLSRLTACPNVLKPLNVIATLSDSVDPGGKLVTEAEAANFDAFCDEFEITGQKSLTTSASFQLYPHLRRDVTLIGKLLYGLCPFHMRLQQCDTLQKNQLCYGLKPVMRLSSRLDAIRECKQGELIGTDGRHRAARDTRLGIASIGYGDGLPFCLDGKGIQVLVNGRYCNIVGNPELDYTVIDLGNRDKNLDRCGDEVVFWGDNYASIENFATRTGCPIDSLAMALSRRVPRLYS